MTSLVLLLLLLLSLMFLITAFMFCFSVFQIIKCRTYKWFSGTPLFSFGYGLSYTTFHLSHARWRGNTNLSTTISEVMHIDVVVEITGGMDVDEDNRQQSTA